MCVAKLRSHGFPQSSAALEEPRTTGKDTPHVRRQLRSRGYPGKRRQAQVRRMLEYPSLMPLSAKIKAVSCGIFPRAV